MCLHALDAEGNKHAANIFATRIKNRAARSVNPAYRFLRQLVLATPEAESFCPHTLQDVLSHRDG